MKRKRLIVAIMLFGMMLGFLFSAHAQRPDPTAAKVKKFLSKLKPGEWVDIEGVPQKNFTTILLLEIEVIYGEMEEDDWELNGQIQRVNPEKKMIYMLNVPIKFDKNVEYEDDLEKVKSFSDLRPRMFVEVEGTYLNDSTFLAAEIGQVEVEKGDEGIIEWTAKVEAVDVQNMTITIMGHSLTLTKDTKIKSPIND